MKRTRKWCWSCEKISETPRQSSSCKRRGWVKSWQAFEEDSAEKEEIITRIIDRKKKLDDNKKLEELLLDVVKEPKGILD